MKKIIWFLFGLIVIVVIYSGCSHPDRSNTNSVVSGDSVHSMNYRGITRNYQLHIPPLDRRQTPMPLVLVLHGGGGTGLKMKRGLTLGGFDALADKEGFVVAYPDGVEKHWNDGRRLVRYRAHRENVDDVGFISQLIDHLVATLPIDSRRVHVTGISNGGLMSYRLACELTDKIAAIAAVTASLSGELGSICAPSEPVSVLIMNGTEDPLVPYEGGDIRLLWRTFGRVVSTRDTVEFWKGRNRCASAPLNVEERDEDPRDGTKVRRERYGCNHGVEVVLYTIDGGGHTWPSGYQYLPEALIGRTSTEIDANQVIWEFFKGKKREG